jgi:hypothetical protein
MQNGCRGTGAADDDESPDGGSGGGTTALEAEVAGVPAALQLLELLVTAPDAPPVELASTDETIERLKKQLEVTEKQEELAQLRRKLKNAEKKQSKKTSNNKRPSQEREDDSDVEVETQPMKGGQKKVSIGQSGQVGFPSDSGQEAVYVLASNVIPAPEGTCYPSSVPYAGDREQVAFRVGSLYGNPPARASDGHSALALAIHSGTQLPQASEWATQTIVKPEDPILQVSREVKNLGYLPRRLIKSENQIPVVWQQPQVALVAPCPPGKGWVGQA